MYLTFQPADNELNDKTWFLKFKKEIPLMQNEVKEICTLTLNEDINNLNIYISKLIVNGKIGSLRPLIIGNITDPRLWKISPLGIAQRNKNQEILDLFCNILCNDEIIVSKKSLEIKADDKIFGTLFKSEKKRIGIQHIAKSVK